MTSLMKAKVAPHVQRDMILFSKRYQPQDCLNQKIVDHICEKHRNLVEMCCTVIESELFLPNFHRNGRFKGDLYRTTLQKIKMNTFKETYELLASDNVESMGFSEGKWSADGKVSFNDVSKPTPKL
mmetsp:Transcript_8387/g.10065  ORF Transcript_8387/g.10065 Transcript_8387/m.10065 type:complete len:126 (+) Transcript_8387:608-985(+)